MNQPNIVLILGDNLGWGELGCYGGGILRGTATSRIDALASEGLRLTNFNVESDCVPTRSALMTGRHPIRTGPIHLETPWLFNLTQDPKEETDAGMQASWARRPLRVLIQDFQQSLRAHTPIPPGAPDDYQPVKR